MDRVQEPSNSECCAAALEPLEHMASRVREIIVYSCRLGNWRTSLNIAAYLFEATTVQAEKQPLLANGSETTSVSRQRLRRHVPAVTDTYVTLEVLLETVFSTWSV
jgi:hypothetical protein